MASSKATWQLVELSSPHLPMRIEAVAVKGIPYIPTANRLQTLNVYLPKTSSTTKLLNTPFSSLPASTTSAFPQYQVHIHGGAWRDPDLTASSIEAAAAHAFSDPAKLLTAIASINYTISPFPSVPDWLPTKSYEPIRDNHSDPAREARHPQHICDVLSGFALLRELGLKDGSFILTGHSAGACLAMQSALQSPQHFGLEVQNAPRPAAVAGLNGLYDLPALVHSLGDSHAHLSAEYASLQSQAFGTDESVWASASPALFDAVAIEERVREGKAPKLVLIDQSFEDQLVPMNQAERLERNLKGVKGVKVIRGKRCTGKHAAPWEEGVMIWETVKDILELLKHD